MRWYHYVCALAIGIASVVRVALMNGHEDSEGTEELTFYINIRNFSSNV
ncbi:hypothetical protein SDC9_206124 [bioreactor metagenome]|uniref:Uncharacterized protein n=1 Tax=bioreactor metagenome TaxID=1076179 RepID=A0A645J6U9_9ZZZZ